MARNYLTDTDIKSAITASENSSAIDVAGYAELSIHVVFGTCQGVAGSSGQYVLQTSNNKGDNDWVTMTGDIQADKTANSMNATTVHKYFPDNATAGETGFGRWVRYRMIITGAPNLSYTTYLIAKE